MDAEGRIARVRYVDDAEGRLYLDLEGGSTGSIDMPYADLSTWSVGDVAFATDKGLKKVDPSLWSAGDSVGEVKHVSDDAVVISVNGNLRHYPQRDPDPFVGGQVVQIGPRGEPGTVLSDEPIDHITIGNRLDDFDIASLIIDAEDNDVTLDQIGGSEEQKRRAENLVRVALNPDNRLKKIGANQIKGILFSGPSGTGKTYLAKALASITTAKFYNISGPVIAGELVGQSERRLRDIFDHAAANKPAILFFDEIDSLYTQRTGGSNEHSNRLVGQFLALLDGFKRFDRVIVIAATNIPGALDDALLRPGRLGHKLVFDFPDEADRYRILEAQIAKPIQFMPGEEPPLDDLASKTVGWTAADLAAIWTEAGILADLDKRDRLCLQDVYAALPLVQRVPQRIERNTDAR
jgi:transitional endoplasmic reticulum ATPase